MRRKGVELSVNVIIIAAISLAVLVVLFAIFTGRLGVFTKGVQETDTCAQKCASLNANTGNPPGEDKICFEGQYIAGTYSDGKNGCCCVAKT